VAKISAHYREQALRRLREALDLTPASERAAFVRKYLQADPDLSRFAGVLGSADK
jgi:hypothetical protein